MEIILEGDYFDGFFQMWSIGLKNNTDKFSVFLSLEQRNSSREYEDEFEPFLQLSTMFQHSGLEFKQYISIIEGDEDDRQENFLNQYNNIIVKPFPFEDLGYKTPNYLIVKDGLVSNNITIESGDYVFEINCEPYDDSKEDIIKNIKKILKSNKNGVEILEEHPGDEYW